jgi:hypothetical protein
MLAFSFVVVDRQAHAELLRSPPRTEVPADIPSRFKPTDRIPVGFIRLFLAARTLVQGDPAA